MLSERSCHPAWRERDFREFGALQNFAMHFVVAAAISAFAAGCINDDRSTCFASRGIEPDCTALELENPVDGVQDITQREGDFRLHRVEPDDGFLCTHRRGNNVRGEQSGECQQNARAGRPGTRRFAGLEAYARKNFHPKSTISAAPRDESGDSPVWMDNSLENSTGLF